MLPRFSSLSLRQQFAADPDVDTKHAALAVLLGLLASERQTAPPYEGSACHAPTVRYLATNLEHGGLCIHDTATLRFDDEGFYDAVVQELWEAGIESQVDPSESGFLAMNRINFQPGGAGEQIDLVKDTNFVTNLRRGGRPPSHKLDVLSKPHVMILIQRVSALLQKLQKSLGRKVLLINWQFWNLPIHGYPSPSTAARWHRDQEGDDPATQILLALTDGALTTEFDASSWLPRHYGFTTSCEREMPSKAGDLVLFDTLTSHRAFTRPIDLDPPLGGEDSKRYLMRLFVHWDGDWLPGTAELNSAAVALREDVCHSSS